MSKKIILTILVSLMMVFPLLNISYAEETASLHGERPSAADTHKITIMNIEKDATVIAYHIVKAEYNDYGLIGWIPAKYQEDEQEKSIVIEDLRYPKASEITTIANLSQESLNSLEHVKLRAYSTTQESKVTTYTADVSAGMWLVMVGKTNTAKVYNPMIVSNTYSNAVDKDSLGLGEMNGVLNAEGSYVEQTAKREKIDGEIQITITDENMYAKSSEPTLTKGQLTYEPDLYTITFNPNAGNNISLSETKTYNVQVNKNYLLPRNTFKNVDKKGTEHKFLGWSKNPSTDDPEYENRAIVKDLTTKDNNITLYAIWD